jgi:hypothetical protein
MTENVDPSIMRKMLDYVYSGQIDSETSSHNPETNGPSKLTIEASRKLLEAAHKYQIGNLKEECLSKLLRDISVDTVGDLAVLAFQFDADFQVKKQIKAFLRR